LARCEVRAASELLHRIIEAEVESASQPISSGGRGSPLSYSLEELRATASPLDWCDPDALLKELHESGMLVNVGGGRVRSVIGELLYTC